MEKERSYESSLLRVIIGYLHVSLSEQLAETLYGKPHHTLSETEKEFVQSKVIHSVMALARQVGEEAIEAFLKPPTPAPEPSGPIN
jgi:hypothetical protein